MSDRYKQLIYRKRNRVGEVTRNRPAVLNALSIELYTELGDAVIDASNDRGIRVIVITGAGRAFSTGGDLKEGQRGDDQDLRKFIGASSRMLRQILDTDKIVVTKVNGV